MSACFFFFFILLVCNMRFIVSLKHRLIFAVLCDFSDESSCNRNALGKNLIQINVVYNYYMYKEDIKIMCSIVVRKWIRK